MIYILPKTRNHPCLKKPAYIFISRRARIIELRVKIGEILSHSNKNLSVEQLVKMARLWRLETGENVLQIERDYENETRDNLPIPLEGRILKNDEIIEEINVAD